MTKPNTAPVPLEFPIERGEEKRPIGFLTLRRPKTGDILKLVKLFGSEIAGFLSDGDRETLIARLKSADEDGGEANVANHLAAMLAPEKLDGLVEVVADLFGISPEDALGIDPADYPEIWKALTGFFPGLTLESLTPGSPDPVTSPLPSDGATTPSAG